MKTNLRGRDFISTQVWTKEELETVLHLAFDLKMKWGLDLPSRLLEDKTLFMLFFFSSTRTRNSFEAGMTRLGGHAIFLEPDKMQISHGDTPKEIGKILSSYGHGIAIRHCDWGEGNKYLRDVAEHARVPVINMQCDIYHPCQAMADVMTLAEHFGKLEGRTVAFIGDGNNVARSLAVACGKFGMRFVLASPNPTPSRCLCRSRSSNSSRNLAPTSRSRTPPSLN